ncbi:MAG: transglutaminase family protein [Cytophagales bacterium]
MKFKIIHTTVYQYFESVPFGHHKSWLIPRDTQNQVCEKFDIQIGPKPADFIERTDIFGNKTLYFTIPYLHKELVVTTRSIVKLLNKNIVPLPLDDSLTYEQAINYLNSYASKNSELTQYLLESPFVTISPKIREYALESVENSRPVKEIVFEINQRINQDFEFVPGYTNISTPISQVMLDRKGVCQDFSHLAIACFRSIGLLAKYMSGYIETLPPPGQTKLKGADASHAWLAVYAPNLGWIEIDPTNNVVPKEQHVLLSFGRDYSDVPPIKGVIMSGSGHNLLVSVDMEAIE